MTGEIVGTIQPVELPETATIIGDHWPQQDENAYAREADNQRMAAGQAQSAASVTKNASSYTEPAFRGDSGTALTQRLEDHHVVFSDDQARHENIAGWLSLASQNIDRTKTAMNAASIDYHKLYEDYVRRAVEHTWPQSRLAQAKTMLLERARSQVVAAFSSFEEFHLRISAGIAAGTVPNLSLPEPPNGRDALVVRLDQLSAIDKALVSGE
ncbi:hypothetical protein [Mycolicibacterium llatzerense]|uniref:hypothetical protein n=1 Tax=Mycolicibacterium llatzerense TaxID=280871 RepID=UPI0008DCD2CF|nr:hypothetical protein [Mycolicibacterium llatzerense]